MKWDKEGNRKRLLVWAEQVVDEYLEWEKTPPTRLDADRGYCAEVTKRIEERNRPNGGG
jgi:hypothetical protein